MFLFPLLPLTFCINPYRSYQFFLAKGHSFVHYNFASLQQLKEDEDLKRKDCVVLFIESLTDFVTLVASIVLILTGLRTVYLISILTVNGHVTCFNSMLKKLTSDSPRLWIKLQQIKTVMEDPVKKSKMAERYLSLKQCVWLAFVELVLDFQVLPFIAVYIVLVPWRLNELMAIAVEQYEGVPANKLGVNKFKHVARDVSRNKLPKRA